MQVRHDFLPDAHLFIPPGRRADHMTMPDLDTTTASAFARMALAGIVREYPHKPDHVLTGAADVSSPRDCHPAFYGCYDWHSAVHSHWLLVMLWRRFPGLPERAAIEALLSANFQAEKILAERDYAASPARISFERPYGWAWLFKLAEALHAAGQPRSEVWLDGIRPLVELFSARLIDWLPRQQYPVRSGLHANTAFMLAFAHDFAQAAGDIHLSECVREASLRFFAGDRAAPSQWEPGGSDFLSPSLVEAELMRRVLAPPDFPAWLEGWLPDLANSALLRPVDVADRGDPQGVHLDGLNLSRAWCLAGLANALHGQSELRARLAQAASQHVLAALPHVQSEEFLGEHWLATFAVLAMTT